MRTVKAINSQHPAQPTLALGMINGDGGCVKKVPYRETHVEVDVDMDLCVSRGNGELGFGGKNKLFCSAVYAAAVN